MAAVGAVDSECELWFVLNFVCRERSTGGSVREVVERFNRSGEGCVDLFAPRIMAMRVVNGRAAVVERPLMFHYVFVRGRLEVVKRLCAGDNGLSFVLDRGSERRYAVVSPWAMDSFMRIARCYENSLPLYDIGDIDLEEGDRVEVVDGPFAGLSGTYMPRKKSTRGNVVIALDGLHGSIAWDVEARHVRILSFAPGSKRAYDQVEAFVPRLLGALRKFHAGCRLGAGELAALTVFCRRMEAVRLENHKLEAKLLALLAAAQNVLGDYEAGRKTRVRYERRRGAITNPWTSALVRLVEGVSANDRGLLEAGYGVIAPLPATTRSQRQLREEYAHYLG